MPSVSPESTLRLKTNFKGDYKALDTGTAIADIVSPLVSTSARIPSTGFLF